MSSQAKTLASRFNTNTSTLLQPNSFKVREKGRMMEVDGKPDGLLEVSLESKPADSKSRINYSSKFSNDSCWMTASRTDEGSQSIADDSQIEYSVEQLD